jgi:microcompartment protein CcmL/EutN
MSGDPLALIELDSIASGLRCIDAMVKKAPITILEANLIEPGHFLILFSGALACVEESFHEALFCYPNPRGKVLIPTVHEQLFSGLQNRTSKRAAADYDSLGIVETSTISDALLCCDRVLKEAYVDLVGIRLTGGLGGKGYFVICGAQHDIEEALVRANTEASLYRSELIARPHVEMVEWLFRPSPFLSTGA